MIRCRRFIDFFFINFMFKGELGKIYEKDKVSLTWLDGAKLKKA